MSVRRKVFKTAHFQKQEKRYTEHCCVPLCSASSKFNGVLSFHSFPTHSDLRSRWLINIRRDPFTITSHTKVCSRHFTTDQLIEPTTPDGRRRLVRGAVPTLFEWNGFKVERSVWERAERPSEPVPPEEQEDDCCSVPEPSASAAEGLSTEAEDLRREIQELRAQQEFGLQRSAGSDIRVYASEGTPPPHPDHDYAELLRPLEKEYEEAPKVIRKQADFQHSRFLLSRFQGDDETVQFYTGFPDYTTLEVVFAALQPTAENMAGWSQAHRLRQADEDTQRRDFGISKLALIDQFFLFLCRVRRGFPELDLAVRFSVSQPAVNRICVTWANFLHFMLGSLPIWPSRETVNELMPPCFRATFPRTRVILACTEIHVQRPSSTVLTSEMHSNYNSNTTFKGLIGISPSGKVTFVSDLYTGSLSDREMTQAQVDVSAQKR
ncbi:uncharacterized protein LOC115795554 [Archocentrus centrarchus]|uniref:uncharacterized protein LOC115795554 n=1 Tax=Archocentrus centrarchus TaxID=63155 RepID=UPI0011E9DFAC|nr:uncharacterized protein LOC115795554 [Archocentrus centrarchus]